MLRPRVFASLVVALVVCSAFVVTDASVAHADSKNGAKVTSQGDDHEEEDSKDSEDKDSENKDSENKDSENKDGEQSSDDEEQQSGQGEDDEFEAEVVATAVCTFNAGGGTYVSVFGYKATNTLTISVGKFNNFAPGAADRGQPTKFNAGTTNNAVVVTHTGKLTWKLANSSAAAPASEECKDNPLPLNGSPLSYFLWIALAAAAGGSAVVVRRRRARVYY